MREDEYNEFKKSTVELNEGIISISAILNKHRHGKLWFGLKNDGTPSRFEINDNTIRDVSRKIHEGIKPEIYPDIYTKIINEGEVIVVNFEGNNVPYSAFGRYYIRTADEDRELVPTELKHIWQERFYEENWENRISSETIDDIDDTVFRKFFAKALQCGRIPFEEYEKESLAKKLGILNGTKLTNAGRILFSKNHPLILKMAVFATDHKETFLDISRQEGNIFQLIDAAISYIVKNIRWRVELSSDYIHRNEIPEIPLGALRESVINSFAHAQYDIPVQHEIDVFSNRISIINPGSFANEFTPLDFAKGDLESRLRNPVIANTLYLCHDIEAFGSGLKKIYSLCEEHSVDISYSNQENVFKLEFSRFDRNSDCRTNDRISQNGTLNGTLNDEQNENGTLNGTLNDESIRNGTLNGTLNDESNENGTLNGTLNDELIANANGKINETEFSIYLLLKNEPILSIEEIIEKTGKSKRTINRVLASLKTKGLIERIGSKKIGYWETK